MPDQLLQFDRHLFHFINHDLSNSFFDWLMPLMRNAKFWIPLYLFIIIFFIWVYKRRGLVIIVSLAMCVGFADFTSASMFKYFVKRDRPCRDAIVSSTVIARVPCGTGYSFPSTHATDHFAIAVFLCFICYKKWPWVMPLSLFWAALICFAQVYVGVHFPVDVLCGAIYGALVGWAFSLFCKRVQHAFNLSKNW
ncbi:phosphatase PAP2 family protein [Mucilaginibacter segetis]|uniref:Phosphatase PAP2 family protein n=1 Tax=Mucilaginibacter segetis TaxID=2793071 RepID=A0A934PVI5_9SPHI|nr:phosphatase PAP2 family protein [Mucilaginibacter segetis]MBK0380849.1 phosphatase PAP2 family protein [Mucilaginibacter segetis]